MGALLGPVGELWEIRCAAQLQESFGTPLGTGAQMLSGLVRYQHAPRPRRVWDVSIGTATPEDAATLAHRAARRGDVTRPVWWISEEAQTANVLTPQISTLADGHQTGGNPVATSATLFTSSDGWRPLTTVSSTGLTTVTMAPSADGITTACPHDRVFTASAYLTRPAGVSDCSLRVQEIDQSGTVTQTHYSVVPTDAALQRRHITAVTQPTTVALRMQAFKALAVADPAITFTPQLLPFAVGLGASRVVVNAVSHNVQRAAQDVWDRRSGWDYQIMEVG